MPYPFKHPRLYGEAAMQDVDKKDLAKALGMTMYQLRLRQDPKSQADFDATQMRRASEFLGRPATYLFNFDEPRDGGMNYAKT